MKAITLEEIFVRYAHVEGIKIDIEAAEIPILEELTWIPSKLKWIVLEYSFDFAMSIERFRSLLSHLGTWFQVETSVPKTILEECTVFPKRPYQGYIYGRRKKNDDVGLSRLIAQASLFARVRFSIARLPKARVIRAKTWDGKQDSRLFGRMKDKRLCGAIRNCAANTKHPELFTFLKELIKTHDDRFKYTTINVNRNIQCKEHLDAHNIGDSIIVGLGDYTGGAFVVKKYEKTIKSAAGPPRWALYRQDTEYDINENFVRFCGFRNKHCTRPFDGERFSIVYFTMFMPEAEKSFKNSP